MKLISWNVNGIRAATKKGLFDFFNEQNPNVLCLQETKATVDQLTDEVVNHKNYLSFWSSPKEKKGYSGTAIYTNIQPISASEVNDDPILRNEGRIIKAEFEHFYLLNIYFPNGGGGPLRLAYKMEFYDEFLKLVKELEKTKPVIFCGDVNTAHTEIDLARPKENEKTSGFMPIERAWVDKVIENGFIDCFREFNKEGQNYTWWDMKSGARARNTGWRIDYFFVSASLKNKLKNCYHLNEVMGSDHCPIVLELDLPFEETVKEAEAKIPEQEEEHLLF
jgi:exodeoxyribonuclease-3